MASYNRFTQTAAETRRNIGERLCRNKGIYGSCGGCEYSLYSQALLKSVTFREIIGIMSPILVPTLDTVGTPNYAQCGVLCSGDTITIPKVIDSDVKVICDATLCRFMATEWLGYNGTRDITTDSVKALMDIITNSTTSRGLVDALYVLYANYGIWDMNGSPAAGAASGTQDGKYYRYSGVRSDHRY